MVSDKGKILSVRRQAEIIDCGIAVENLSDWEFHLTELLIRDITNNGDRRAVGGEVGVQNIFDFWLGGTTRVGGASQIARRDEGGNLAGIE